MLNYKTNSLMIYISAGLIVVLLLFALLRDNYDNISLKEARKILNGNSVRSVVSTEKYLFIKTDSNYYKIPSTQVSPLMLENYNVEIEKFNIAFYILALILFLGLGYFLFRQIQKKEIFKNINNSLTSKKSKDESESLSPILPIKSDVTFNDIGGISDVKIELEEIIDFMKNPKRYKAFGARMPMGVLLIGPPGVGKTMIAQATAHEADVPFYYQSGASFVQIYVGMGAKRVHELFEVAKKNSPSIIFIDEIDAVGKKRDGTRNDERESTLNQLLTEMDGFEGSSGVVVLAATNKIDVLDSALLRAGRFDRRIFVELPTKTERESILSKYLLKIPHNVDLKVIANMTIGFNGASLAALVNEAALLALREKERNVTMEHFNQVKDKVMFGKKKLQILSDKQKKYRVSYQAGKVLTATYFDLSFEKLMLSSEKLTPSSNEPLIKHELESRVKMLLSGIVACSIKYNEHASSSKDDLDEAKALIESMLNDYGMGDSLIKTDNENSLLMKRLYDETTILIKSMDAIIDKVENIIYEKESITKNEVKKLIDEIL